MILTVWSVVWQRYTFLSQSSTCVQTTLTDLHRTYGLNVWLDLKKDGVIRRSLLALQAAALPGLTKRPLVLRSSIFIEYLPDRETTGRKTGIICATQPTGSRQLARTKSLVQVLFLKQEVAKGEPSLALKGKCTLSSKGFHAKESHPSSIPNPPLSLVFGGCMVWFSFQKFPGGRLNNGPKKPLDNSTDFRWVTFLYWKTWEDSY